MDRCNSVAAFIRVMAHPMVTPEEMKAAVDAYNRVWDSATNITAATVDRVREEAMEAALEAAHAAKEETP